MGKAAPKILAFIFLLALLIPFSAATSAHGPSVYLVPQSTHIIHPVTVQTESSKVVVFDESKGTYRDHNKLSYFIDYLNNTLNRTVIINTGPITMGLAASADIIIIPNPGAAYSEDEIEALHRFVENGGALLVMGDRAPYFNPDYLNPIVAPYNITFLDVTVEDNSDNSYTSVNVIAHVFNTNDTVVQELTNNVTDVYMYATTALNVSSPAVPVAFGDNDTYVVDESGNQLAHPYDGEIVMMAYYVYPNDYAGRVFVVGSTGRLRDNYGYFDHNKPFVENLMNRLAQAHKNRVPALLVTSTISSDVIAYHDNVTLDVVVESSGSDTATNVTLTINLPTGLEVVEGNTTYFIGDMAPGDKFEAKLVLKAVYTLEGNIVVNATGSNVAPVVQTIHVRVIPALSITAVAKPTALNINERNDFTLQVNLTNISLHNVTDVSVDLTLPSGITGDTHATVDLIQPNETAVVEFQLTVNEAGVYSIKVSVSSSDAMPYPYTLSVAFIATTKPNLIVLDLGHTNRPPADEVTQFVDLLKSYGTVVINNGTITKDLLSATKLYILAYPKYGLTESEIDALIRYVENGGSLVITGNAARYSSEDGQKAINAIAERFGVYFMDVTVMDDTNNSYRPYTPIIHVFNTQDPVGAYIFNGVKEIYYQAGTALTIKSPSVVPLAFGDDDTYLVDKDGNTLENVTGTNIVTMAYRRETGKIFFIGSVGRFRDKYDYFSTNYPFINNLISRLLAAPQVSVDVNIDKTSVNVGDQIKLTITISNEGLDVADVQIGVAVGEGLKILNVTTVTNTTINAPYVTAVTVEPGKNVTLTILIKAEQAGDREVSVYYAILGEVYLAADYTVHVASTTGEEQGTSKAVYAGLIALIIAIIAILYYLFVYRKQA